jgi:hypothetical protein
VNVIIAGSRTIGSPRILAMVIDEVRWPITRVFSGMADENNPGRRSVDMLGVDWANRHGIPYTPFRANWDDISRPGAIVRYRADGKPYDAAEGHRRNRRMAEAGADALIFLWDGTSPGTRSMFDIMLSMNKLVYGRITHKGYEYRVADRKTAREFPESPFPVPPPRFHAALEVTYMASIGDRQ